ncbi:MAG: hypothetical protein Ct9H300mP22_1660 [Gammaproteobacteria bacterium]|nr:MAG: hypothetical protein Ct9H300mP22_1660 [Gammaproteobacteria bacterium]
MKHLVDLKQISILLLLGLFVACSGDSNETGIALNRPRLLQLKLKKN